MLEIRSLHLFPMKTLAPSNLRACLAILISFLTIVLPAGAQVGQVIVQGRKASDSGLLARVRDGANPGKFQAAKGGLANAAMTTKAEFRAGGLILVGQNCAPPKRCRPYSMILRGPGTQGCARSSLPLGNHISRLRRCAKSRHQCLNSAFHFRSQLVRYPFIACGESSI